MYTYVYYYVYHAISYYMADRRDVVPLQRLAAW